MFYPVLELNKKAQYFRRCMYTKKSNLNLAQLPVVKTALGKTLSPVDNATQCTEPFCNREKLFR